MGACGGAARWVGVRWAACIVVVMARRDSRSRRRGGVLDCAVLAARGRATGDETEIRVGLASASVVSGSGSMPRLRRLPALPL